VCWYRKLVHAAIGVALGINIVQAEDAQLRKRFLAEAPAAWSAIVEKGREASCNATWSRKFFGPAKEHRTEELAFRVARAGDNKLLEEVIKEGDSVRSEDVTCANDRYSFRLDRPTGSERWEVSAVAKSAAFADVLDGNVGPLLSRPVLLHSVYLPDLLRHGGFKLINIDKRDDLVVAKFTFDPSLDRKWVSRGSVDPSTAKIRDGTMTLLPDHQWVLSAYDVRVEYPGPSHETVTAEYEYEFPDGRHMPLLKSTHELNTGGLESVFSFSNWKWSSPPISDFQMSQFGVPEPGEFMPPRKGLSWLFWVNLGVILLVLSVILRRRFKAKQSISGPSAA
jgi:hypothetical protein